MLQTLRNAWKQPDIRRKLLFVVFILFLYRIGTVIPVPFFSADTYESFLASGTILEYLNVLSGGSLEQATLFALGINPYITASIVIQLLTVAIPALERLAQQGEEGKKKINNITRYVTVGLALITAFGYYLLLRNSNALTHVVAGAPVTGGEIFPAAVMIACYCAGASLVMWLAEKINENGLGNGISLILFANIVSRLPHTFIGLYDVIRTAIEGAKGVLIALAIIFVVVFLVVMLAMLVFCVFITGSERRIPVQYAKRVVGRKMMGGQSTNLPMKLNMSGVMPVIFASSIISLPATIMAFCGVTESTKGFWGGFYRFMGMDGWFYPLIFALLIVAFSYFYVQISFNPLEVSNNLKKNGGMIPGVRQGRPTTEYISKILKRVTLIGAFFLMIIAVLPIIAVPLAIEPILEKISADLASLASSLQFGGTSLLIVIGVALETARDLEAQLTMRSYKGFLN